MPWREWELIMVDRRLAEYGSSITEVVNKVSWAKVTRRKGSGVDAKPRTTPTPQDDATELDALLPPDTVWLGG
jgi:hypothetical protein